MNLSKNLFQLAKKSEMYGFQEELYFDQSPRTIINKSRQIGVSDIYAYKVCMNAVRGSPNLIFSPSERQSNHFADYAKFYFEALRPTLADDFIESESRGFMSFKNGGYFHSLPNSPETVRGLSIPKGGLIVLDEYSHFDNPLEIWNAVYPMVSRGGSVAIISTPNGEGNHYAELWRSPDMGFRKFLINYKQCPFFTPAVIADLRRSMDELSWRQEYENEFIGTVLSYFPMTLLNQCKDATIRVWEYPEDIPKSVMLIFGIDLGRNRDKTAIVGIDTEGVVRYRHTLMNTPFPLQEQFIEKLMPFASLMRIDRGSVGYQLAETLQTRFPGIVIPVGVDNRCKLTGFINLRMRMEGTANRIVIPDDFELKRALNLIQRKQYGDTISFEAPRTDEAGHSDLAIALMLATHPGIRANLMERGWVQTVAVAPAPKRRYIGIDVSIAEKDEGFAVAHAVEGLDGSWCLIDARSERLSFPEQLERIKMIAEKHPSAQLFIREEAYHAQLKLANLHVLPVKVPADKIERFNNIAPFFKAGKVKALATCDTAFFAEWAAFPNGSSDDTLDATTLALTRLLDASSPLVIAKGAPPPGTARTIGNVLKTFQKVSV